MRPLYFINVFWGEEFTAHFVDLALRSLLFPGNLPSVENKAESRLVVCTTAADRARLEQVPAFQRATGIVPAEWIMIEAPESPRRKYLGMSAGHQKASDLAFRRGAVGIYVTPDAMFSDGSVRHVQKKIAEGCSCLLAPALRIGLEPFLEGLRRCPGYIAGNPDSPPVLDGRALARLALAALHPESARYDWESPHFSHFPVSAFLWNRAHDGILLHTFSWSPCLLDYAALAHHDSSTFEQWTLDGDYVYRNFGRSPEVQVVSDSDDLLYVGFTPIDERPERLLRNRMKTATLGDLAHSAIMDPLKRDLFRVPVRMHAGAIDAEWGNLELRGAEIAAAAASQPGAASRLAVRLFRLMENSGKYGVRALVPEPLKKLVRSARSGMNSKRAD